MATISVFNESENRIYQVNVNLFASTVDKVNGAVSDADIDYYLKITTNIRKTDGTAFGEFMIRNLSDVPVFVDPSTGLPAVLPTTFTGLVNYYVDYFLVTAEIGQSSSISSNSSSSSSSYIKNWSSSSSSKSSGSSSSSS